MIVDAARQLPEAGSPRSEMFYQFGLLETDQQIGGFDLGALATARTAVGCPMPAANCVYVIVRPAGMFLSANQTRS